MSSIIFGPFRLLGIAHLFNWLFRWPVGVDMCRSCRPEVRIRRRVREKNWRISNLLKTFEVRTLSNLNVNFVTSPLDLHTNIKFFWGSTVTQTQWALQFFWMAEVATLRIDQHCYSTAFSVHSLSLCGHVVHSPLPLTLVLWGVIFRSTVSIFSVCAGLVRSPEICQKWSAPNF